jgi:hypothetical protein
MQCKVGIRGEEHGRQTREQDDGTSLYQNNITRERTLCGARGKKGAIRRQETGYKETRKQQSIERKERGRRGKI